MSRYVVAMKTTVNFKKNYIYRVTKESLKKIAIIDEKGIERWVNKDDTGFKDFKILYWWRL